MKQMVQKICALTVAALLLTGGALADTLTLEGTVGGDAVAVYAPIGGTVAIISGDRGKITEAMEYLIEKNVGVEVIQDERAAG